MRTGWRGAWGVVGIVLFLGAMTAAGPRPPSRPPAENEGAIRLTLDISWGDPALPTLPAGVATTEATAVTLGVEDGKVVEAQAVGEASAEPQVSPDGSCRLGGGASGRVRVRVETRAGSALLTTVGGVSTRFPIATLLDGPQRTGPASPIAILVERTAWDALEVRLGPQGASDGVFPPGATIPAAVGFNILLPEPAEVAIRYSAELRPARGGDAVWTLGAGREVVATNTTHPPGVLFAIPAPRAEGSYELEVRATWEPIGVSEGSRLARIFKRRRVPFPTSLVRRTSLVVMAGQAPSLPSASAGGVDSISDSLDLARPRASRAMATGRSPATGLSGSAWAVPEAAVVEAARRNRFLGWNLRGGPEAAQLAPADASGLTWSALALRVAHPGRPHRLTIKVAEGGPSDLGVALVAPGGTADKPRLLLDAAASGPAVAAGAAASSFSWPVWPDSEETVLVLVNRSDRAAVTLASIELRELAADPTPAVLAETHPENPRPLALDLAAPGALDRFGGMADVWGLANNLAAYATHCGASTLILADDRADHARRAALDGQADEDATGPDRLDLILRILARRHLTALLDIRFDGSLPGLPPVGSPEALARGLVRVDRAGKADGPAFQPLRAEVRDAMKALAVAAIGPRGSHPNLAGLVVRLGPGASLPGGPEVGLDDATYSQFIRGAFQPEAMAKIPGLDNADPNRFAARFHFVSGQGRDSWLEWRSGRIGQLYTDLALAVKTASAGAVLAVATPGMDDGPAGVEARRADRAGLAPIQAWRAVGLDLEQWPTRPGGPIVLRGVGLSTDDLGHDLATSADLDAAVAARSGRGLWLGVTDGSPGGPGPLRLTARPIADGPPGEELLGHALAVLDARWVVVSGAAAAGQEDRLARFSGVFRSLPAPPDTGPPTPRLDSGVAVRSWASGGKTYVAMANDTPYTILLESVLHAPKDATVDDLGRRRRLDPAAAPGGGKSLVLELPPFGVASLRVGDPTARIEPIGPYLPSGRELVAQYERLSARLGRLARGGPSTGPTNPGFEEPARPRVIPVAEVRPPRPAAGPTGWTAEGEASNAVEIDTTKPHSGGGALRLDARTLPASIASAPFLPPGRSTLGVQAWLRADQPGTTVRVKLEGDGAGRPFIRHVDGLAGPDWAEFRLQVTDLPPGGLDRVRLRFERTTPGPLWLDDVAISGDGPSESARRVQRILTAALHAYREKRYADFARLSGSYWARQVEPDLDATAADPAATPIRTGRAATDLPVGRRLR